MCAKNIKLKREQRKVDCDRCGFTFNKRDLSRVHGMLVCKTCRDEPSYKEPEDG